MTDENADENDEGEDEARDKHAIRGGTEFVEKLHEADDGEEDEDEDDNDE